MAKKDRFFCFCFFFKSQDGMYLKISTNRSGINQNASGYSLFLMLLKIVV